MKVQGWWKERVVMSTNLQRTIRLQPKHVPVRYIYHIHGNPNMDQRYGAKYIVGHPPKIMGSCSPLIEALHVQFRPVGELDVEQSWEDVTEWRCRDAVKAVKYNHWWQFVVIIIVVVSMSWDTSLGDAGQILTQFTSRLTVDVEHSWWVVAEALSWPDSSQTTHRAHKTSPEIDVAKRTCNIVFVYLTIS